MMNRRTLLALLFGAPLGVASAPRLALANDDDEVVTEDDRHPLLVTVRDALAAHLRRSERAALSDALENTALGDARAMLRAAANTAAHLAAVEALRAAGFGRMTDALRYAPAVHDDESARAVADAAECVADDVARELAEVPEGDDQEGASNPVDDPRGSAAASVAMAASQLAADAADPSGYEEAEQWDGCADAVARVFTGSVEAGVPRTRALRTTFRIFRQMEAAARRAQSRADRSGVASR